MSIAYQENNEKVVPEQEVQLAKTPESGQSPVQSLHKLMDRLAEVLGRELVDDRAVEEAKRLRSKIFRRIKVARDTVGLAASDLQAVDLQEMRLTDLTTVLRQHESQRVAERDAQYAANREQGEQILTELKQLLDGAKTFEEAHADYHRLREAWGACRPLDRKDEVAQRKTLTSLSEQFYQLHATDETLRLEDYRKNQQSKRRILARLEELVKQEGHSILLRHEAVLALAETWSELGPVAPEARREVEGRYKELTTHIFKLHQAYYADETERERMDALERRRLCERAEQLSTAELKNIKAWETSAQEVRDLQQLWRRIGYHTSSETIELRQRFRAACTSFFDRYGAYKRGQTELRRAHEERKRTLIEEVKTIATGEAWTKGAERIKEIQTEWKTLNASSERSNLRLFSELRQHIDLFFERRDAWRKEQGGSLTNNLEEKNQILSKLETLVREQDLANLRKQLEEIAPAWRAIGPVPQKQRDKVNQRYKALMDEGYARLREDREQRRFRGYATKIEQIAQQEGGVSAELRKLEYALGKAKSELQTYDNNLSIFNVSKGAEGLLRIAERKREQLVQELARIQEKIDLLRTKQNEQ